MNNSFNTRYILVKRPNTHKFSVISLPTAERPFLIGTAYPSTAYEDIVEFINYYFNDKNANINAPESPSPKGSHALHNSYISLDSLTERVNSLKSLKRKRHDLDREIAQKEDALMNYAYTLYPQYGESIYSIIQEIIDQ